jgi:hypothetical protein
MKIIDADCHISPSSEGGNSLTLEDLLARMDLAGVDMAMTWLQPPYLRDMIEQSNSYIHQAMKKFPDRILGYGWADPNLGVEKAKDMVKRCVQEYGFYGVKLNGAQNYYAIDDPELALPVIEEIAKLGSRVAFHIGADSYNNTHPYRLAKVAALFPETTIFAVHMGGASFDDMSAIVIELAEKYPNILLIGSAVRAIPILTAVKRLGAERVCFGSDTPFELMHVEVAKYRALFDGQIASEEYELIMGGNIIREFGLVK